MIDLNDVLLAMSNIPVDDPIAEIWGRGLQGGYKIIEYTGSLPITIRANGDVLIDYRIYGADGGVGEPTDSGEPAGYKLPIAITDKNLLADNISQFSNGYVNTTGGINPPDEAKKEKYSDYVSIVPNTSYTFAMTNGFPGNPSGGIDEKPWRVIAFYKQNKTFINRLPISISEALNPSPVTATSPNDAFFARVAWRSYGSEECPVLVTNRNVYPVYIGENQLGEDEYVSFSEQKIYKRTENLIPSPEPQTQTGNGITAICDGNGVYTFTGTSTDVIRFEFPIEEFTTPNTSDTDFIVSLFNTKGLPMYNSIGIGSAFYINPVNRVIKNPSASSNKKVNKISFSFQPNTETNFTISPMLVLGTVAPSQFVPHIVPTDPPVPFPEIPTIDGETVIDYDGDPKPSQMYIKYRKQHS